MCSSIDQSVQRLRSGKKLQVGKNLQDLTVDKKSQFDKKPWMDPCCTRSPRLGEKSQAGQKESLFIVQLAPGWVISHRERTPRLGEMSQVGHKSSYKKPQLGQGVRGWTRSLKVGQKYDSGHKKYRR